MEIFEKIIDEMPIDPGEKLYEPRELARNLKEADVVIDAYSFRSRWYEFHKPERFLALGRKVALSRAHALMAATGRLAKTTPKP